MKKVSKTNSGQAVIISCLAVIFAPFATIVFNPGFWPCEYQVLLSFGTNLLVGIVLAFIWPEHTRRIIMWTVATLLLIGAFGTFNVWIAMGMNEHVQCSIYASVASIIGIISGLVAGKQIPTRAKRQSDSSPS